MRWLDGIYPLNGHGLGGLRSLVCCGSWGAESVSATELKRKHIYFLNLTLRPSPGLHDPLPPGARDYLQPRNGHSAPAGRGQHTAWELARPPRQGAQLAESSTYSVWLLLLGTWDRETLPSWAASPWRKWPVPFRKRGPGPPAESLVLGRLPHQLAVRAQGCQGPGASNVHSLQ